jgi:hypothetical protein
MMKRKILYVAFLAAAFALPMLGCGSFAPPKSCGEGIGGTADEALFAQHFSSMELIREATGIPPVEMGGEKVVSPDDPLAIKVQALSSTEVRVCVQERVGGGGIPLDKTFAVEQGESVLSLGGFSAGSYVVRVIVDGTLVRNLPFEAKG